MKQNTSPIKSIVVLALPAIAEMALSTLLGIVDTLMISHYIGSDALAASGFANQIVFAITFIFTAFNIGAVAVISRCYGENDYQTLKEAAGNAVSLNVIIGIGTTVLMLVFQRSILAIYSVTPEVMAMTLTYFSIVMVGQVFMFYSFAVSSILRGAGDTLTPMKVVGLTNLINIVGNIVLIKGVWVFPEMGIAGAAWATSLSRIIGAVLFTQILFFKSSPLRLTLNLLRIKRSILKPLWRLSVPGAVEQLLMQASFVVGSICVSQLDTASEAAMRVLLNIESISFMPAVGLSIAAATLVGKALGENDKPKAVQLGKISYQLGAGWGVLIGLVFSLIPEGILRIYTSDADLIALSVMALYAAAVNQPVLNFSIVISGALRGAGDTKTVMLLTSLRIWLIFVPLLILFVLRTRLGLSGLWVSETISLIVFSVFMLIRFRREKWVHIAVKP